MSEVIHVGMADLRVGKAPCKLISAGLGSCVGICLFDAVSKVGGLAHIMLPSSLQARNKDNRAKFADTALPDLIVAMVKIGAKRHRLVAKIAGGAQMFAFPGATEVMRIGERNVEAVIKALKKEKIPLLAQDVGGNFGRTIQLFTENGDLYVRTINQGERVY